MWNEWRLREYVFLLFLYSSNLLWKEVPPNFRPTVFSSFELLMQVLCNDKAELFSLYIFPRHSGSRKKRENQNCVICLKFGCTYHWGEQDWTRSPLCSAHDRQQKTVFDQAAMQGNLAVDAVLHISCCRNISLLRTAGYGFTASIPFLFLELSNLRKGHQDIPNSKLKSDQQILADVCLNCSLQPPEHVIQTFSAVVATLTLLSMS